MLKIYLAQWDAERFFRTLYDGISESCLIQFEGEDNPMGNGTTAWFFKSGGEKIICLEKGETQPLGANKDFRIIPKGSAFFIGEILYTLGNKGIISRPKIIDSSLWLRKAAGDNHLERRYMTERFGVLKRRDNGEVINYAFDLKCKNKPLAQCYAFQDEACFYDPAKHLFEPLESGSEFEFIGRKFYTYSPEMKEICFAQVPQIED